MMQLNCALGVCVDSIEICMVKQNLTKLMCAKNVPNVHSSGFFVKYHSPWMFCLKKEHFFLVENVVRFISFAEKKLSAS